jgi:Tfp pilus assembly protein PilF
VEQAARFVAETAGSPGDPEVLSKFPANTFEGYLRLIEGREAVASLDAWSAPEDPAAVFEPFFLALEKEPSMEAARKEICLAAVTTCVSGALPIDVAEDAVRRLIAADRGEWRAFAALAQIQLTRGEVGGAVDSFHRALELEPGRASLRFDLGMALLAEDRTGRAAKVLETVKADPHVGARALLELGKIRAAKGDEEGAIDFWRRSIETDPDHAVVYARLGAVLVSRGEFAKAEEVFRRGLEARWPAWELHYELGAHQAEQDRYSEAVAELGNALRLRPDLPEAHLRLGRCHAAEGRKQSALAHLRRALDGPEEVAEAAWEALGELSSKEHEENLRRTLEDAIERPPSEQIVLLKELLKVEAGHADARIRLGLAYVAEGKGRAAEKQFRKVLKSHPDDPQAWSGLATALRARKKLKAAAKAHEEAIERAPNHAPYHLNLADTLLRQGRTAEAAARVDMARSCDPHHPLLPNFAQAVRRRMSEELPPPKEQ